MAKKSGMVLVLGVMLFGSLLMSGCPYWYRHRGGDNDRGGRYEERRDHGDYHGDRDRRDYDDDDRGRHGDYR